ncbi:MAG: helix-turn-helix domain-containing protein [Clostridia bacterium]
MRKIEELMDAQNISFSELAKHFSTSKQTLSKKLAGTLAWTFSEMLILSKILGIEDIQQFFFGKEK